MWPPLSRREWLASATALLSGSVLAGSENQAARAAQEVVRVGDVPNDLGEAADVGFRFERMKPAGILKQESA